MNANLPVNLPFMTHRLPVMTSQAGGALAKPVPALPELLGASASCV